MPRVHHVKKARKDNPVAKKGESYFWWKFRYSGKNYSKVRPARSRLTQSSFLSQLYDIQDEGYYPDTAEDATSTIEDLVSQLENLRDECQENFDNIPEQLQEAFAGETLTMRIDSLDDAINELESIDTDTLEGIEEEVQQLTTKNDELTANLDPTDEEQDEINESIQELEEKEAEKDDEVSTIQDEIETALSSIEG